MNFATDSWFLAADQKSVELMSGHVTPVYGGEFFLYTSARKRRLYSRGSLRMRNYLF